MKSEHIEQIKALVEAVEANNWPTHITHMEMVAKESLPALKAAIAEDNRQDCLIDSNFIAGVKVGWNFGVDGNEEGYRSTVENRRAEITAAKEPANELTCTCGGCYEL